MAEEQRPDEAEAEDSDRARFRAALDRKAGKHVASGGRNQSAPTPHTGPAKPQRTFRRKSG